MMEERKKTNCYFCAKQADVCGELDMCFDCGITIQKIRNYKKREEPTILHFLKTIWIAIKWIARGRK